MSAPRTCECMACNKCYQREWARNRYRQQAYGTWDPKGDIEKVRAHIAYLKRHGVGHGAIAQQAKSQKRHIQSIVNGERTWISRTLADRILTVGPNASKKIPAYKAQRRLQALNAIGHTTRDIAHHLNVSQQSVWDMMAGKRTYVTRPTMQAVTTIYDQLCMTPGGNRLSVAAARRNGYAPPMAWADIDDPDETPTGIEYAPKGRRDSTDVDEVVVLRLLALERVPSTPAEKTEALRRWLAAGGSEKSFCEAHGWKHGRYRAAA